jgi:hypothetical protein
MGIQKTFVAADAVKQWIVVLATAMLALALRHGPGGD